ncbi:MAG: shikimate dehydrogenase [Alphaproteobacteria bacterium]|nr:shikimate dehydrogenase [Alphaproteobacteria bacterium]
MTGPPLRLGLIGNGIQRSSAPRLHEIAGAMIGRQTDYPLFDLEGQEPDTFEKTLRAAGWEGRVGVNVTHPYKERAMAFVPVSDPRVRRIGSINTVLFDNGEPAAGFNTDHSGFMAAYQRRFPATPPGRVAVIGTGGVGRPIVAGLIALGATEVRVYDTDSKRAHRVAAELRDDVVAVRACDSAEEATHQVDGIVNATPVGMYHHPGLPLPESAIGRPHWVFDAVYTPIDTEFLTRAAATGATVISGYELFIYQGLHAFHHFTGQNIDETALRTALGESRAQE